MVLSTVMHVPQTLLESLTVPNGVSFAKKILILTSCLSMPFYSFANARYSVG